MLNQLEERLKMEKGQRIFWEPQYTVHDKTLDLQHQELFAITNQLMDSYENGSNECYGVIEELVKYISRHFYAEQMLMMKADYPDFANHMKAHEYFTEKVEAFLKDCRSGKNITHDIIIFLRDWLFAHTTGVDLEYGEYLLKLQAHTEI